MRRQVADPNDADAGLCDRVIVFDRAAADADGSDQHAFLVNDWKAAGKSDQAVVRMFDSKEGANSDASRPGIPI